MFPSANLPCHLSLHHLSQPTNSDTLSLHQSLIYYSHKKKKIPLPRPRSAICFDPPPLKRQPQSLPQLVHGPALQIHAICHKLRCCKNPTPNTTSPIHELYHPPNRSRTLHALPRSPPRNSDRPFDRPPLHLSLCPRLPSLLLLADLLPSC